jgi:hypothetical protein
MRTPVIGLPNPLLIKNLRVNKLILGKPVPVKSPIVNLVNIEKKIKNN